MDAFQISDLLVSHVKSSNLNYSLQESPFSIHLSIRKSFIKNQNGDYIPGFINNNRFEDSLVYSDTNLVGENEHLKNFKSEKIELEKEIYNLSIKLEKAKVEIIDLLSKNKTIAKDRETLEKKLKEKDNETFNLKNVKKEKEFEQKKLACELFETKKDAKASIDLVSSLNKDLENASKTLKLKEN